MGRPARFPWREYRRFCLGVLRWSPREFWDSSVWDVIEAYEGFAAYKGVKENRETSLTPEDVRELKRMMDQHEHD